MSAPPPPPPAPLAPAPPAARLTGAYRLLEPLARQQVVQEAEDYIPPEDTS